MTSFWRFIGISRTSLLTFHWHFIDSCRTLRKIVWWWDVMRHRKLVWFIVFKPILNTGPGYHIYQWFSFDVFFHDGGLSVLLLICYTSSYDTAAHSIDWCDYIIIVLSNYFLKLQVSYQIHGCQSIHTYHLKHYTENSSHTVDWDMYWSFLCFTPSTMANKILTCAYII